MIARRHIWIPLAVLLLSLFHLHCLKSTKPGIPASVRETLDQSGLNSPNFLKILLEYKSPQDSVQLHAAYFLIEHMMGQYGVHLDLLDSIDTSYHFHPEAYASYADLVASWDSIEQVHGRLHYEADSFSPDVQCIQHGFFINNLDSAYGSWINQPFGYAYSFEDFCRWILPYRVANEPMESFRSNLQERYSSFLSDDAFATAASISRAVNHELKYDDRYNRSINTRTLKSLDSLKRGNLLEINIHKVKSLRSAGLAATLDYIPYFADSSSNLFWSVVFDHEQNEEALFYSEEQANTISQGRIAKIYRRTYHQDTLSLFFTKEVEDHTPPFLGHWPYTDVTTTYIPTIDIEAQVADSLKFVYISVFNDGQWKAVDWAHPEKGVAVYKELGKGIVYLLQRMENKKLYAISNPFIILEDGSKQELNTSSVNSILATISHISPWEPAMTGKNYILYFWEDGWKPMHTISDYSTYKHQIPLPQNRLYLLSEENQTIGGNRIFIIGEKGEQLFY